MLANGSKKGRKSVYPSFSLFLLLKIFNADTQAIHHARLAQFIELFVQHSENAVWMQTMLTDCLFILCENNETSLLVADTVVHFYFRVVMKRHGENEQTPFWRALGYIRELIYGFIVGLNDDYYDVIMNIANAFFNHLESKPEVIPYDNHGMGEIIGKFFSCECLDVNLKVLSELIAFGEKHLADHNQNLLQMCANQAAIINGITLIILEIESVRAKGLALELAYKIQR